MAINFEKILLIIGAVILLFGGPYLLRFLMRYLWRIIRIALIAGILLIVLGHFLGLIQLPFI
jgi:predicted benzoate:H+ symporter BenE